MKITSLKEFYNDNSSKDIRLYREYLGNVEAQLIEAIKEANALLGENDESVKKMQNQRVFVHTMTIIIDSSIKELMFNSIGKLSDEELMGIIDEAIDKLRMEKQNVKQEIDEIGSEFDKKRQEYMKVMQMKGYSDRYYEASDTAEFFAPMLPAGEFLMKLINSNMDKETLKNKVFSTLYAIDSVNEQLADMVISLRKIASVSDEETLKKAIRVCLTPEKIGKIIGIDSDEECTRTFDLIQKEVKMQTEFFKALDLSLQKDIVNNGLIDSVVYKRLESIYKDYQEHGKVKIPKNDELVTLDKKMNAMSDVIDEYNAKISRAEETKKSRQKMEELIRSMVNVLHFEDGWSISKVAKSVNDTRVREQELRKRAEQLQAKKKEIKETHAILQEILAGDCYSDDMDIVCARDFLEDIQEQQRQSRYDDLSPVVEAETRRLRQFEILGEAINELNEIKEAIDEIDRNHNLFMNIMGTNRTLRKEKVEQYRKIVQKYYNLLNQTNLLCINVLAKPESEGIQKPLDFDQLLNLDSSSVVRVSQFYQITEANFEEYVSRGAIDSRWRIEEVNNELVELYNLASKLLKAEKREDGVYEFAITSEEISALIGLQENLISIFSIVVESRESEKKNAQEIASQHFTGGFHDFVNGELKMQPSTLTRDALYEKAQSLCDEYGSVGSELEDVVTRIQEIIEAGTEPFDMLEGFEETVISPNIVKKNVRL